MSALEAALQDIIIDRDDGTPNYLACCLADVEFGVVKHRGGCSTVLARQELSSLRAEVERLNNFERREEIARELLSVLKGKMIYREGLPSDGWAVDMILNAIAAALNAPSEGQKRE